MTALPLLGAPLVAKIRAQVSQQASDLSMVGCRPRLAIINATSDESSALYARMKIKWANRLGIETELHNMPSSSQQDILLFAQVLELLGQNHAVHGIFIERPLPSLLQSVDWATRVPPYKDVEGEHPVSIGKLFLGLSSSYPSFVPTTALACMEMLRYYGCPLEGKHAVVVGRSITVGKPLMWLLLNANATVTVCHSRTVDLASYTKQADIVVMATGHPMLLQPQMVKPGAVILDVGVNYLPDGTVVGDVDYEGVSQVASAITPPTGGLGPVTTALLLHNVIQAAQYAYSLAALENS